MSADVATFHYTAKTAGGQTVSGTIEAPDGKVVAAKLREQGYVPVSVAQTNTGMKKEIKLPFGGGGKVKTNDLAVFSRQFATMIESGLSLVRALNILAKQTENPKLGEIVGQVRNDLEEGRALSEALAEHEEFPRLYIAMVRAGEAAGMLDQVLLRVADTLEKDVELRAKIKSALTYPVVVLVVAIAATAGMLIGIVPVFDDMFASFGGDLPAPTQVMVTASEALRSSWYLILPVPIVAWQVFKRAKKKPKVRYQLDKMKLKLPVFGGLLHKMAISRFSRNFGTLLKAGVPILQALEITSETVNNDRIGESIADVGSAVSEGEQVAAPLARHEAVFPAMVTQMIAVGEETGAMDTMLNKVADFYDREVSSTTDSLTSLLEPLMIVVIGAIVGGMVITLYLPMFSIFDQIV